MTFEEFLDSVDATPVDPAAGQKDSLPAPLSAVIGAALPRVDGPLKTTGRAMYASDYNFPRMVYAVPVGATVGKGRITAIDSAAAERMPGVLLVLHHGNLPPVYRNGTQGRISESRPPFEDDRISYWGQYVALAVAETFQQAMAAAAAIKVSYAAEPINVKTDLNDPIPAIGYDGGPKVMSKRGDTEVAFAAAPVKLDATYITPAETHNPMEMHATVAVWEGKKCTLYETSQGVVNHHTVMAQVLGVPKENLDIVSRFIGSGFGGKLFPWPHSALAAVAAQQLGRPVKLTLTRKQMFSNVGHRPRTQQRVRLGASPDGKLLSLQQDYRNHTSEIDDILENCGEATPFLYSTENLTVSSALTKRNVGTPTPMRGPGAVPGLFAVESAMDELARELKMDPIALRMGLDTQMDEEKKKPFSSRKLKECLQVGSERFGWSRYTPAVGSMRKGDLILGWGVAAASWSAGRAPSEATLILRTDGTARISSATQDIGTGTYTIVAQIVSDKTGIPVEKIEAVLGDSSLVPGPMSGGSTATASVVPAVALACTAAIKSLAGTAVKTKGSPLFGKPPLEVTMTRGMVHAKDTAPETGISFDALLKMANLASASGEGKSGALGSDTDAAKFSTHSFGAQFVEVEWDPGIARLRVSRVVTVIDGGRILNPRTATNQVAGAVVMGIGMGLLERTNYDQRDAHPTNDNYADYLVATSADSPEIDVHFLDIPDPKMGEYGARGIGEIGLAGVAPAITAAVYHATGIRVRELPVRIEDLLKSTVV